MSICRVGSWEEELLTGEEWRNYVGSSVELVVELSSAPFWLRTCAHLRCSMDSRWRGRWFSSRSACSARFFSLLFPFEVSTWRREADLQPLAAAAPTCGWLTSYWLPSGPVAPLKSGPDASSSKSVSGKLNPPTLDGTGLGHVPVMNTPDYDHCYTHSRPLQWSHMYQYVLISIINYLFHGSARNMPHTHTKTIKINKSSGFRDNTVLRVTIFYYF